MPQKALTLSRKVEECAPLADGEPDRPGRRAGGVQHHRLVLQALRRGRQRQGLTIVHFPAQPQPFLSRITPYTPLTPPYTPLRGLHNPCTHPLTPLLPPDTP